MKTVKVHEFISVFLFALTCQRKVEEEEIH